MYISCTIQTTDMYMKSEREGHFEPKPCKLGFREGIAFAGLNLSQKTGQNTVKFEVKLASFFVV